LNNALGIANLMGTHHKSPSSDDDSEIVRET
jgi:hypothetical protein